MKKKILSEAIRYAKWLLVILYLSTAFVFWHNRKAFYQHIPHFFFETMWFVWFLDAVLFSLILAIFVCLVQLLRCPPLEQCRFQRVFRQTGLCNKMGEYPSLLSKKIDRQKAHGYIYKLRNVSIPMSTLDSAISQNERSLRLKVSGIDYGRNAKTILLYAVPTKYAKPNVIAIDNEIYAEKLCKLPNLLCVGQTGSGKSYALSVILATYARCMPNISITIADYKHSLLTSLAHTPNYYGYDKAVEGIFLFYQEFKERLAAHDSERNKQIKILLIDEYSALIGSQDKKKAEELKTMISNMLLMSRSLGLKIIIGMQTAYSEHFKTGARDQFHAILALGNLSKEQKQMLFSDHKEKMNEHNGIGEGYLLIDGKDIEKVSIAEIKNIEVLNDIIQPAMYR